MAFKIEWTIQAKLELLDILDYWNIRNGSNTYSVKLFDSIDKTLNILKRYPKIGRLSDFENVRKLIVRDYNIYYAIRGKTIVILKVWDVRKDPLELII